MGTVKVGQRGLATSGMTACAIALWALPAFAAGQPAPAELPSPARQSISPPPDSPADIVVTARRVEERLQDVPISITVFNQQQLSNRDVTNAADLATYTPSLSSNNKYGAENSTFSIRGFTQEDRTASSVAVYFADVVAPRGGGTGTAAGDGAGPGSFFDLQNVQILKGPQGTLFGRNTTGGAVLLVPQKPTDKLEGYGEVSFGNYAMKRIQAVINLPLNDDIRLRLGVDRQKRDGYENNISGIGPSRFANIDYVSARASLVVDVTPELENYTIGTYVRSDTAGTLQQAFVCNPAQTFSFLMCPDVARQQGAGRYAVQNELPDARSLIEQWQIINTTTWKATDDLTVKNIFSYAQFRSLLRQAVFGTDLTIPSTAFGFPTGALAGLPVQFAETNPGPGVLTSDQSTLSEEFQVQGRAFDNRLTWQAGGYFEQSNPLADTGSRSGTFISCQNIKTLECTDAVALLFGLQPGALGSVGDFFGTISYRNLGVYSQGTYALTDKLKLTAGARYTWDKSDGTGSVTSYAFSDPADPSAYVSSCQQIGAMLANGCRLDSTAKSSAPTWTVDLEYQPVNDILVYAKYSRGYRQGNVNPNGPIGATVFGPEKVDTYEAGAKTSFAGAMKGSLNVTGFYNNLSHQQLQAGFESSTGRASPIIGIVNAGKSRIWGIEVELSLQPLPRVRLDASYAYLNTKLLSETAPNIAPGSVYDEVVFTSEVGGPLSFSPSNKFAVTGSYNLPIADEYGRLSISATDSYSSSYSVTVASPYGRIQPVNLVNLNLNWNGIGGSQIDGSLFVTNLFDKFYTTFVPGEYDTAVAVESRALGQPRMFGGRLRIHFGA
jgi:iron complex outermembrane receptor protein